VLALKIDLAGLYGTGSSGEPLGLKLTTGVGTEDFAAAAPTFAEVVALESDVATANALLGSPVYLMNAAMRGCPQDHHQGHRLRPVRDGRRSRSTATAACCPTKWQLVICGLATLPT
jgi:hypothetical protein